MKQDLTDVVFGYRAVLETINSGKTVEKVLVQKGSGKEIDKELSDKLREHQIPVQRVPIEKLNRITRKNHQGIIGFISPIAFHDLENLVMEVFEKGVTPLFVLLDQVTDVRNFGAICRSAECMGAHGVLVPMKGSARIGSDAMKTSSGALSRIPVCRMHSTGADIRFLKDSGFTIVGCTEKANKDLNYVNLKDPLVLIMGSEDEGLDPKTIANCDQLIKIPMTGTTASLNVSVAAGIALYEIHRQRTS